MTSGSQGLHHRVGLRYFSLEVQHFILSRNGGISYSLGGRTYRSSSGPITLDFLRAAGLSSSILANVLPVPKLDVFGNPCEVCPCSVISLTWSLLSPGYTLPPVSYTHLTLPTIYSV